MPQNARDDGWSRLGLPYTDPAIRNLLLGLLGLYVAELAASVAGLPVGLLAWAPLGAGFAIWQPITCYFVQGNQVTSVVFGLLGLWFMLPALLQTLSRRQIGEALLAAVAVGTLLPLLINVAGFGGGLILGWPGTLMALFCLFGLAFPDATVRLNFVLPVTGPMIVWGSLLIASLQVLASFGGGGGGSLPAFHQLGLWLGVYAWWNLRGPGARRRNLRAQGRKVERRFQVLQGGEGGDDYHRDLARA